MSRHSALRPMLCDCPLEDRIVLHHAGTAPGAILSLLPLTYPGPAHLSVPQVTAQVAYEFANAESTILSDLESALSSSGGSSSGSSSGGSTTTTTLPQQVMQSLNDLVQGVKEAISQLPGNSAPLVQEAQTLIQQDLLPGLLPIAEAIQMSSSSSSGGSSSGSGSTSSQVQNPQLTAADVAIEATRATITAELGAYGQALQHHTVHHPKR